MKPEMLTTPLLLGEMYYYPNLGSPRFYSKAQWVGSEEDYMRMRRGLVHMSATKAIKHGGILIASNLEGVEISV